MRAYFTTVSTDDTKVIGPVITLRCTASNLNFLQKRFQFPGFRIIVSDENGAETFECTLRPQDLPFFHTSTEIPFEIIKSIQEKKRWRNE